MRWRRGVIALVFLPCFCRVSAVALTGADASVVNLARGSGVSAVTAAAMDLEITGDDDAWASDVTRGNTTAQ